MSGFEIAASLVEKVLEEYMKRLLDKVSKGERLTQAEVSLLMVGLVQRELVRIEKQMAEGFATMNKRIDDLRSELLSKNEETNKRIDDLRSELYSKLDDTNKRID
ncbi:hypothetical protein B9Q02_03955, partial [Candidatus Marsarchaeota G1 archaeon BE_D]